jgi:hypothetical protein
MSKSWKKKEKIGSGVLISGVVICIAAAIISSSAVPIPVSAAPQAEDTVTVTVNAPEYVENTFNVTIDVDNVTDLNSAQFDLFFDSSVVNVIEVREGEINGEAVPIFMWNFVDADNGQLVDAEAEEIDAEWYDDEVTVLRTVVRVDAPEYVTETFNATIRIDNVTDFNSAQFDLFFDSSVVNVIEVREGEINGEAVPIFMWNFVDADGEKSVLDISNGQLVDAEAEEIDAEWYDDEVTVVPIFDTGEGTYPSIFGTHEGTITPSKDIPVQKMYTYPCIGTGGHSEYVKIWNATWEGIEAHWNGYTGDYHNIVFGEPFTLYAGETYNYLIKTGSYPQIRHTDELEVDSGTITCEEFVDANGRVYTDWIPAIKLW